MARFGCKCRCLLAGVFLSVGCADTSAVFLDTKGVRPAVNYDRLTTVLDEVVTSKGLLNSDFLKEPTYSAALDAQLKLLAVTGPTATPRLFQTAEQRLAYWYNARAAWAMKLAMLAGFPETIPPGSLRKRTFPLDGRRMTLDDVDAILDGYDDWRVAVCAPGVCCQRAPLPRSAFAEGDIRNRIAERLNAFVDDEKRFVIDVERRNIRVPPVLCRYRQRLIADYHRAYGTQGATFVTALSRHLSGSARRRLRDAIGYRCVPARRKTILALLED
jgi:hypothetical protein